MDEKALNELLECSVCLDRLDSQSKVLPCQHTFCRWCLEEIISTKKELRCPECRYLVEIDIQDLPANILLIRLLEGMKNAARSSGSSTKSSPNKAVDRTGSGPSSPAHSHDGTQKSPSHKCLDSTSLPCAKALYSYDATEPGDLSFKKSDIILLRKQVDENWYHGELNGRHGFFPATYVQVLNPMPNKEVPSCKATYDFQSDCNERDCLTFQKDTTMTVIRRIDDNWIEGKLGEQIGIFPVSFVEMNDAAKMLINFQASLVKNGNSLPNNLSAHTRTPQVPPLSHSSACGSTSAQNHTSSAGCRPSAESSTSTGPSSTNNLSVVHRPHKRHSLTTLSACQSPPPLSTAANRHSMEITGSLSLTVVTTTTSTATNTSLSLVTSAASGGQSAHSQRQVPQPKNPQERSPRLAVTIHTALYNYKPQKDDELELIKGDFYSVTEKCQDGWYKGLCVRTGQHGVFPGNYVHSVKVSQTKASGIGLSRSASSVSGSPSVSTVAKSSASGSTRHETAAVQSSPAKASHNHVTRTHSFPKTSPLASMEYQVRLRNHGIRPGGSVSHPRPITNITQAQLRSNHSQSLNSMAQSRSQSMLITSANAPVMSSTAESEAALSDPEDNVTDNKSRSLPLTVNPQVAPTSGIQCPARTSASSTSTSTNSPRLSCKHAHNDKCSKSRGRVRSSQAQSRHSQIPSMSYHPGMSANANVTPPNVALGATGSLPEGAGSLAKGHDKEKQEKKKDRERLPVSSFLLRKLSAGIPARIKKSKSPVPDTVHQSTSPGPDPTVALSPHRSSMSVTTAAASSMTTPIRTSSSSQTAATPQYRSGSGPSNGSQGATGASGISAQQRKTSSSECHQVSPVSKPGKVKPLARDRYRCIAPYPPQNDSEVELKVNEIVYVHKKRDDGWFKGTLLSSGKSGLFPGSFVERC